jgi:Na+-transporting methylmalonyl-CoA/oxaloacetate decarboxylase gamma subunit
MLTCTSIGPGFLLAVLAIPVVVIILVVLAVCALVMGAIDYMHKKTDPLKEEVK